jgi:carbonic anhydrase
MQKLIRGILDFRKTRRPEYAETFARLALGQKPDSLFIACSDSRVVPNLFASTEPGDLFVLRNVGNIVSPCGPNGFSVSDESEAAALEFAIDTLKVKDVIICGHSECGAISALLGGGTGGAHPHLDAWLRHAAPALEALRSGRRPPGSGSELNALSQLNVLAQCDNLRTYPVVREAEQAGRLRLHAWWFDIAKADVLLWNATQGRFDVLSENAD